MKALYFDNNLAKVGLLNVTSVFNKEAAFGRLSPFQCGDIHEPSIPNPRWLKIRNKACGLCGTDLTFIFMKVHPMSAMAALPAWRRKFLGHELLGEVVEVGSEVVGFAVGDRVGMRMDWPTCFEMEIDAPCPQCARGNYMLCEKWGTVPPVVPNKGGGFSPYMVMHRSQAFKIPEALTDDQAVLMEPVAVAVHGVYNRMPQAGEKVLVIGAGTIGLLTLAVARALQPEAEYWCLARYPFQAEFARKLGAAGIIPDEKNNYGAVADACGGRHVSRLGNHVLIGGFDLIYDSVGNRVTVNNALRWGKGAGQVVLLGADFKPERIDFSPVWSQEVTLSGIDSHATESDGRTSWEIAADLLASSAVNVDGIITHRFALEEYKDAIRTFVHKGSRGATKIIIEHV